MMFYNRLSAFDRLGMKMIRSAAAGLLAAGAVLLPATAAVGTGDNPSPWTPYASSDWVAPAGMRCDFTLSGEVLEDKERFRTTERFPDGSPRYQEFTGQLVVRYTNEETGDSVVRNLTGRGDFEYFADGGWSLILHGGHIGVGIGADGEPGRGYYVVTGGGAELHADADGRRTLTADRAKVENLCDTLG